MEIFFKKIFCTYLLTINYFSFSLYEEDFIFLHYRKNIFGEYRILGQQLFCLFFVLLLFLFLLAFTYVTLLFLSLHNFWQNISCNFSL